MESTVKKIIVWLGIMLIPVTIQAGSITITSPSRNITAEFKGALIIQSPTMNIVVDGKRFVLTQKELRDLASLANLIYIPGDLTPIYYSIYVAK
jgi:hypothetical protein